MIDHIKENDFALAWQIEQSAHFFHWTQAQLLQQFNNKNTLQFGLWHEGQLVAFIILQTIFPEVELLNIAVTPAQQNKKIGRTLLQHAIEHCRRQKFERMYLEVREHNQPAIHLYECLGFNQMGARKNYYPAQNNKREDALLYGKEL